MENSDNVFLSVIKKFIKYLYYLVVDFINSFRYNNMKASAILVAIPGIIIGFALNAHSGTVKSMVFKTSQITYQHLLNGDDEFLTGEVYAPGMPFDYSGVIIFLLMLLGILNIFIALGVSSKKNLGSVVSATAITGVMVILSILYTYSIIYFKEVISEGFEAQPVLHYYEQEGGGFILNESESPFSTLFIIVSDESMASFERNLFGSMSTIWLSDTLSIIGCVLGFIFYDRTYEKVDR